MHPKIQPLDKLVAIVHSQRDAGKHVVFTNGCFDLLHVGHVRYLDQARQLGDLLIIGLNSDQSVRSLGKGSDRPIVQDQERAEVLAALACVDFVTIFDEPHPLTVIHALVPHILVKGGDWLPEHIIGREFVENHGGTVVSIPLVPHVSTTHLVERIRSRHSTSTQENAYGESP
ncbi:MAG: cytidyltransferase [Nitrospirales bacterium]|nr:MAG: cytidyltransferase [Nitrospirales bacterium]